MPAGQDPKHEPPSDRGELSRGARGQAAGVPGAQGSPRPRPDAAAILGSVLTHFGAVGVGHLRPVQKTWLPEVFLIESVLRQSRGKSSIWFMYRWGIRRAPELAGDTLLGNSMVRSLGLTATEVRRLAGLYLGLQAEQGSFSATATITQLIRSLQARRKPAGRKPGERKPAERKPGGKSGR